MTQESQPQDISDNPPLSPRDLLRGIILDLATEPVDSPDGTILRGEHRLPGAKFMIAEILTSPTQLEPDVRRILPERLLKLSVYDSTGDGSVDSITMSDDSDQTVIGEQDGREIDSLTPQEEEKFVRQFYIRHHPDKLR